MFSEPRHRRRLVTLAAICLAALIALPIALSRPEASGQSLSTVRPSIAATEAHSRLHTVVDPWVGMEQVQILHEAERARFFAAVKAEEERQAAIAAEKERQRQAAIAKAAAAKAAAKQSAPATSSKAAAPAPSGDVWHRLAMCETGGKMDNPNTGNGYYGYFQFSLGTWQSVGGSGYPHEHSYGTQLAFAQKLQARSGWGQWPACSAKLGLR